MKILFRCTKISIITYTFILTVFIITIAQAQDPPTGSLKQDSLALVDIYNSTNGPGWSYSTNWLTSFPLSTWHGVRVRNGRVGTLFFNSGLTGKIPKSIKVLTELQSLSIDGALIDDKLPIEIVDLTELRRLSIRNSRFTGSIPAEYGNFENLNVLEVSGDFLDGTIPKELGNLKNLEVLKIEGHALSGNIPKELGNLIYLNHFQIFGHSLTGKIPPELANLKNVAVFAIVGNQLTGSIPPDLGKLNNVSQFTIVGNQLSGSIPIEIGNLRSAWGLTINSNNLTGTIPKEIGNLHNLMNLSIGGDQLYGSVPKELSSLTELRVLTIMGSQISGKLPAGIFDLTDLQVLNILGTSISGQLPEKLGNLRNLRDLQLVDNKFSGSIPKSIGLLDKLRDCLCIYENDLSGEIPKEIGGMDQVTLIQLQDNRLSGRVPNEINNLSNLGTLFLQNNDLEDFPQLPAESPIWDLNISGNKFDFEDFERFGGRTYGINFRKQQLFGEKSFFELEIGKTLHLDGTVGGSANLYQWMKNGVELPGATNPVLILTGNIKLNISKYSGVFTVKVTSSKVKYTELVSEEFIVTTPLIPETFKLLQNYPNPFNPSTTIDFQVTENSHLKLAVYNTAGQQVKILVSQKMDPGVYSFTWDGTNDSDHKVSSGMYIYRLQAGNQIASKKMLLIK